MSDLSVLVDPAAAYRRFVKQPVPPARWIALRRPLLMAVVLGCVMSLMTEGALVLRLALPAVFYWSFLPLMQVACVAAAHRWFRPGISLARAIDLSFLAGTPWLLWLSAYAALWVLLPPGFAFFWANKRLLIYGTAGVAAAWSAYIDFWLFRVVFAQSPSRAGGAMLVERVACWSVGLAIFVLSAGWQTVAGWAGL
jgi:hypothetical protein